MSKKVSKFCFDESAFNFLRTEKKCIGHIVSLKIGCEEFNANLSLRKPTDFEVESAVAAICEVEWGGGLAEHLTFSCQISTANKTLAETLLMNTLDSTEVIVTFVVYQYDDDARKYFVAVKGEELEGNLFEDNGMLSFEVDSQPSDRVQLPRNYNLNFEVVPAEKEQDIEIATNLENKFVANWGVTVE